MQNRLTRRWLAVCALALSLSGLPAGVAMAAEDDVTLNFVGADIDAVVKAVAQLTGRNFLVDPRVKGTINIVSGKPIPKSSAYPVLISALRLQGYSVIEGSGVTKIVPEADAKNHASPMANGKGGEQVVTQVFPIRYESAAQMVTALRPLVSANQSITANTATNTLIVTDSADNLRRLERVISSIDAPHGDDPEIISLRYASAVEVAATIARLYASPSGGNATLALTAVADPRSNRVIIRSDSPGQLARARTLISQMDKPDSGIGNIRVVYLRNAEAARVAQTLRAIIGGETSTAATPAALPNTPQNFAPNTPNQGNTSTAGNFASSQNSTNALVPGSMIQADTASNALIITAPEPVFNNLRNVIDMLDRRRAQVHIEALIVELTTERAAEVGIQWQNLNGLKEGKGVSVIGGSNFGGTGQNIIGASQNIGTLGKGLNVGVVNGQISIPGLGLVTNLGLLARFLETEVRANVLSTPSLLTLDNEEAKIVIGQNLPFVTGAYSTTGNAATVSPFQTYERRDVGLTLKVKPQITEGGVVRVQIYQEASTVQPGSLSSNSGPITNKRSLESNVLVDDGNVIVLGGLIEDSMGDNQEKVPLVGDLPVLGNLFRYDSRNRKKTNLMVFLRPRIIRDGLDYQNLTGDRYEMLLGAQKKFGEETRNWLDNSPAPSLPSLQGASLAPLPTPGQPPRNEAR